MQTRKTTEEMDEAREKEDLKRLEAILFISGRFLNMKELISLTDLNPIILSELIEKLKEKYDSFDSAVEVLEKNGFWKMGVRPEYAHLINKLATGQSEFSKAEQETLAIIAYKQPIKQSVIIKIRGNKAYDHIKRFSELGLIKRKKIGHTNELSLEDDFYDYFNVSEGGNPELTEKVIEKKIGEKAIEGKNVEEIIREEESIEEETSDEEVEEEETGEED